MTHFTRDDVVTMLDTMVAEHPAGYGYAARCKEVGVPWERDGPCCNVLPGADGPVPGCIVGEAVIRLTGLTPQDIIDTGCASSGVYSLTDVVGRRFGHTFEYTGLGVLASAQSGQDRGIAWDRVVEKAKATS